MSLPADLVSHLQYSQAIKDSLAKRDRAFKAMLGAANLPGRQRGQLRRAYKRAEIDFERNVEAVAFGWAMRNAAAEHGPEAVLHYLLTGEGSPAGGAA